MRGAGLVAEPQARAGRWSIDFLFRAERLAVEFDGDYWHSLPKAIERDARKDADLSRLGYRVLRVPEARWLAAPGEAVAMVRSALASAAAT